MEQLIASGLDTKHMMYERGQVMFYNKKTIDLVDFSGQAMNPQEIESYANKPFRYGLYKCEDMAHLVIEKYPSQLQYYFNIFEVIDGHPLSWLEHYKGDCRIFLVNEMNFATVAQCTMLFSQDFLKHLKSCLRAQFKKYKDEYAVAVKSSAQAESMQFEDLIKLGRMYLHP